jgi:hypothetical protein
MIAPSLTPAKLVPEVETLAKELLSRVNARLGLPPDAPSAAKEKAADRSAAGG